MAPFKDHYIYIYVFSRRFCPKRLTVHSCYTYFCQYMCSLGIEPTTFVLLVQCSNHWATGTLTGSYKHHITAGDDFRQFRLFFIHRTHKPMDGHSRPKICRTNFVYVCFYGKVCVCVCDHWLKHSTDSWSSNSLMFVNIVGKLCWLHLSSSTIQHCYQH